MKRYLRLFVFAVACHAGGAGAALAQGVPAASPAQKTLAAAAAAQKYTFLVFHKDNSAVTQAMAQTVKRGVEARGDRATWNYVNISSPAEKALVERFDVGRAPMPLTIAVAPNGAITSLSSKTITNEQFEKAFVTPSMAHCIKSMQDGKYVFVCVQSAGQAATPAGVKSFCEDPQFKGRAVVLPVEMGDASEADFLKQMEISPTMKVSTTVFLAPPAVLVGKFGATATKDQLAAALHKAGKCCDDPNCKHGHAAQPAPATSRPTTPSPSTRRN